jgi:short-subunit dehydrogenase
MQDKTKILVLAGTGSIGLNVCKKFLLNGYDLTFSSLSQKKGLNQKKILNQIFKKSIITNVQCDLTKYLSIKNVIKNFFKQKSKKKVIINCAGILDFDNINYFKKNKIIKFFNINTLPVVFLNQIINKIKKRNENCIIFTLGSSSCYIGNKNTISYCISKHALLGAVRSINLELNQKNIWNVLVNSGTIKNKMGVKIKNINKETLINESDISDIIFNLSKLNSSFAEEIHLKRRKIN